MVVEQEILLIICNHFKTSKRELLSSSRKAATVRARKAAAIVMRDVLQLSYPQIGAVLKRDHATVMKHIKNRTYNYDVELIKEEVKAKGLSK